MYNRAEGGFTLVELVAVIILVGILSVVLFSRLGAVHTAVVQSGRDDLIAALFFAQQQAMMRSGIEVVVTANSVSVTENDIPIAVTNDFYPLTMPAGVTLTPVILAYDKLGRTTATQIILTGSGNSSGVTATIQVDASGYAYAQ
jgi:MSHA pilin protein MshC